MMIGFDVRIKKIFVERKYTTINGKGPACLVDTKNEMF